MNELRARTACSRLPGCIVRRLLGVDFYDRRAVQEAAPALQIGVHLRIIADAPFIGLICSHGFIFEDFEEEIAVVSFLEQSHPDAAGLFVKRLCLAQERQQLCTTGCLHSYSKMQCDRTGSHARMLPALPYGLPISPDITHLSIRTPQGGTGRGRITGPDRPRDDRPSLRDTP